MATDGDSLESQKQLTHYSAVVSAWVETRMEKDKTLLSLATAGIGLLTTLATTVGPTSAYQLWLYGFAGLSFICTIVTAIVVFDKNVIISERYFRRAFAGTIHCWSSLISWCSFHS